MNKQKNRGLKVLSLAVALALAGCAPKGDKLYARAKAALDKGDTNAAVIDLKNLLEDEPRNARARALLGIAFVNSGQYALGEIEIKKAKDLGASAATLLVPSCKVLVAKAEFEKALAECKPESGSSADKLDLQLVNGTALLGPQRGADAKSAFEAVVQAKPESVEGWIGYANAVQAIEGVDAAKATLAKAPAAVRENPRYWLTLGALESSRSAYAEAAAAFKTAEEKTGKAPDSIERLMAIGSLAEVQMRQGNVDEAEKTSARLLQLAPSNPMVMQLRAQVAAAGGKLDEARSLLEQVVSGNPDNYDARALLGLVNMQQGKLDQAEEHLTVVVVNRPGDVKAQQLLAEVRNRLGSGADALQGMQTALEQSPGDPNILATAGRLSLQSGNRDQALTYLAEAAAKAAAGTDAQAQLNVANGYLAAGEVDRALEVLKSIPASETSDLRDSLTLATLLRKGDEAQLMAAANAILARPGVKASNRNMVGTVYVAAGKRDLARQQFNLALKQSPDDVATLMNVARLDFTEGKPAEAEATLKKVLAKDSKNLMATLGLAAAAETRNDLSASENYLKRAVADHPDSVEASVGLAQLYLRQNKVDKAKAVADRLIAQNPQNAAAANSRGIVLMGAKDIPGAIASFEQATKLDSKSVDYPLNLARAKLLNRDPSGALATLDSALEQNGKSEPTLALASAIALQSGKTERAAGYVDRLSKASPGTPLALQMEGDLAMAQGRFREAIDLYAKADPQLKNRAVTGARYTAAKRAGLPKPEAVLEQWLVAHPGDAEVLALLAEDMRARGDRDGAIRLYEQGIAQAPGSGVLANNLAMIYLEKGDPRALAAAEKAYKALPMVPAIQDTYGWALFKAGKTGEAVDVLRSALKGMPDNAEVQYHLAAALAKSGDKAEALRLVQKAVAGNLPASLRADAGKLLGELQ